MILNRCYLLVLKLFHQHRCGGAKPVLFLIVVCHLLGLFDLIFRIVQEERHTKCCAENSTTEKSTGFPPRNNFNFSWCLIELRD